MSIFLIELFEEVMLNILNSKLVAFPIQLMLWLNIECNLHLFEAPNVKNIIEMYESV